MQTNLQIFNSPSHEKNMFSPVLNSPSSNIDYTQIVFIFVLDSAYAKKAK